MVLVEKNIFKELSLKKQCLWPILMIAVMVIWSTFYPIIKYSVNDVDPLVLSFYRYFLGFLPLTPFFLRELINRDSKPLAIEILSMSLLGMVGITLFSLGLFYGIKLSTAVNGALLTNTQPIFTAILGYFLISETFTIWKLAGILTGITGMIFVVTNGNFSSVAVGGSAFTGNLLLTGASFSLSIYSIGMKKYVKKYGGLIPTWISMVSGTFFITLINYIRGQSPNQLLSQSTLTIFLVLYLGLVGTSLTYLLFNKALNQIGVTTATSYKLLIPVSSLILSVLFLREKPGPLTLTGIFIVIAAVYIIQKKSKVI